MGTERPACGLTSLLPNCRGRAEAFARHLQSRLQTLGRPADTANSTTADENSWLAPKSVTTSQPRLSSSSDSDLYFDFDVDPRSPASPVEEITDPLANHLQKRDPESGCVVSSSSQSPGSESSDGPYFDFENSDLCEHLQNTSCKQLSRSNKCNGHINPKDTNRSVETSNEINSLNSRVQKDNAINELLNGHDSNETHTKESPEITSSNDLPSNQIQEDCYDHPNGITTDLAENQTGSYCSTFCRPSDLFIECPIQSNVNQEICNSVPVELEEISLNEPIEFSKQFLKTEEEDNNGEDTTDFITETELCLKPSDTSVTNIKQLLKDGYFQDTGQNEDDEEKETSSNCAYDLEEKAVEETKLSENLLKLDLSTVNTNENYSSDHVNLTVKIPEVEETPEEVVSKPESSVLRSADTDDDEEDCPPRPLRRSTSLKTGKTPPGTPGRKKIVRFADVLGLDLADVRTFLDEVPKVPSSAYSDLRDADLSLGSCAMPIIGSTNSQSIHIEPTKCLVPLFQQPGGQPDFLERVKQRQVCLENAVVKDPLMFSIEGTVRVRNLDFHKSVHIRYTLDGWVTFADLQATYVANSCDGFSDKFSFVLYAHTLVIGQRLEFAVRFQCKGSQFWDGNEGANYTFQCLPPASSIPFLPLTLPSPEDQWAAFY